MKSIYFVRVITLNTFTCSKLTIETPEQDAKYVQKLTIKTPELRHWRISDGLIINFEDISYIALMFLL